MQPNAGPQEAFLVTQADIAIFGGAAGGGKSHAEIMDVVRYVDIPKFSAIYFRRTSPQLVGPNSLWELSREMLPHVGGVPREGSSMDWRFASGATISMRHLQHEHDIYSHQGKAYCGIYFDELTHFTAKQFWYLLSRNRSICGVRPYVRATTNPDPDSFVCGLIAWWLGTDGYAIPERSGVLRWMLRVDDVVQWGDSPWDLLGRYGTEYGEPLSVTFIPSKLEDNPVLSKKDPSYRSRLMLLPLVERMRLLGANWKIRHSAGTVFRRHWFPLVDRIDGTIEASARGWDKAATEPHEGNTDPDWTRSVLIHKVRGGPHSYVIAHGMGLRGTPAAVDEAERNTASQDAYGTTQSFWIDPGQAGLVDEQHIAQTLVGHALSFERASRSKVAYAGPLSSAAEQGRVAILRGSWNEEFLSEAEGFPDGSHDDYVDAASRAFYELSTHEAAHTEPGGDTVSNPWGSGLDIGGYA